MVQGEAENQTTVRSTQAAVGMEVFDCTGFDQQGETFVAVQIAAMMNEEYETAYKKLELESVAAGSVANVEENEVISATGIVVPQ